jgi:hypothetical protein
MSKHLGWTFLFLALLFMSGCSRTSEAKLTITNKGALAAKVTVYCSGSINSTYATGTVNPGESKVSTISWPGRDSILLSIISYPVAQSTRTETVYLTLNNGDDETVNVEFNAL